MKKWFTFTSMTWCLVAVVAFYALGWPLLENTWATHYWQSVPCRIPSGPQSAVQRATSTRYFYQYNGVSYIGSRVDFWDRLPQDNMANPNPMVSFSEGFNATCYVSPNDPRSCVLNLEAYDHLDHALGSIAVTSLIAAAAFILTLVLRRKARAHTRN